MIKVVAVLGPTGAGKSEAAFGVARALGGEVIVCDSRQVYRGFDVGTNKPSPERLAAVPHHLVGVADPRQTFTVHDFVGAATAAVEGIAGRGRLPVLEGGTMLWADALLDGFTLAGVPPRPERRAELRQRPLEELAELLHELDPSADVDLRNPVRVVRAIEVLEIAGGPLSRLRERRPPPWDVVRIGLDAPLPALDARLAERSRNQVERGVVEEATEALAAGVPLDAPPLSGIGHAEAVACLEGRLAIEGLADAMARSNQRYARRQLRWLRRDARITWFDSSTDPLPRILAYLERLN
ncbi:MAG: tRNA (adenosine(37)-N6)-dimethylallyltransferase MiaA [bacterium]|nr:tRNA (adenosine(37)-N6)-dimethylallyltransferase MiaA [bacterium]